MACVVIQFCAVEVCWTEFCDGRTRVLSWDQQPSLQIRRQGIWPNYW